VFWCLSLFLFCIKLAEKNKILPVGYQSSGPLNLCFVIPLLSEWDPLCVLSCSFLSWALSGQGPLQSGQMTHEQEPEQRLKVRNAPEVCANMIRSNIERDVRSKLTLQKFFVQYCVIEVIKCLKVSLHVFCLMSKSVLEIVIIVLCFILYVYDMINLSETKKSNSYNNSLINWVWLKTLFLKLTLTSAINPPKMSPKKIEWGTSQSTPKSFKKITYQCTCGHLS
jgi:hypothetical protein